MAAHLAAILFALVSSSAAYSVPARDARVVGNDNRAPAGTLRGTLLTLRLVARVGDWHPDGDAAPGAPVYAFAEEGRAPTIPGPLIRVRAGTEVTITLRNLLPGAPLMMHGLVSRGAPLPVTGDSARLDSGETRTFRIRLDAPGTYYYWGTTMGRTIGERTKEDAQLTGAIVVDPAEGPRSDDRIFILGMWSDTAGHVLVQRRRALAVINGSSWPHTERLTYSVGDTVRWRVINASADMHPMHLHGFYFTVNSRGNELVDSVYLPQRRDLAVTNLVRPGGTMTMTWSPDRAGNWLFHCHLPEHFALKGPLGIRVSPVAMRAHATTNHALQGMGGLVLGVIVKPATVRAPPLVAQAARRSMRLVISPRSDTTIAPAFRFALDASGASADAGVAPPIVLARGEPVSITVVNTMKEPTAIHWHGIELESYFDGVAGFSGTGKRVSPVIAPGDSFVAQFTPPRAGTFIYHTHIDEERQQPAGLAGPIIVLEPGERFDPAHDLTVIASSQPDSGSFVLREIRLNGSATPPPLELEQGVRYRLRFINVTTHSPGLRFELSQDGKLVGWRPVAKDGAALPATRQHPGPARQNVSIGETADVELVAEARGALVMRAFQADGVLLATMPVRVRAAGPVTSPTPP
jgi:manganese oxidase